MTLYFKILEYLSKYTIDEMESISHLFDDEFLTEKHPGEVYWGSRISTITEFLDIMVKNGHIKYANYSIKSDSK